MRRVTFRATYPRERAHPIHRRIVEGTPISRMDVLAWGPTAAVTSLAWYDAGRSAVAEVVGPIDAIEQTALLERDGGTYAFTYQESFALDPGVMGSIERARVAFLPPVTFYDDGTACVDAVGEQTALSEFYDALSEEVPVEIERVTDFQRGPVVTDLTDRQRAALETALAVGYYDIPRSAGVEAVADELGCQSSTAGELLRKGERAVLTAFLDGARQ